MYQMIFIVLFSSSFVIKDMYMDLIVHFSHNCDYKNRTRTRTMQPLKERGTME